ncbi:tyrosine-type recombinase/integrase [Gracilimonas sediminicola]|uniref:tyrosine-type recombinase/integrase n=1 Tax=Gracilimonas sediminicola TaxID=2952158 RepID=UPI0038D4BEA9
MPKRKLTDAYIRNFKNPAKRVEIYDSLITGLAIRITKNGTKSFVYRYRFAGKVKRFTLGQHPKVGLSKAREEAKELAYRVSKGLDPLMEVRNKIEDSKYTIADLADYFKKRYLPLMKKSTQATYKSRIDSSIIPTLGYYPVKSISKAHIVKFLEKIAFEDGQITNSNRTRAVLSSMMSFAVQKDIIDYNPVRAVKKLGREKTRDRIYSDNEIKLLWEAFELQREPVRSMLMMLLLNGQRLTETRTMRWKDVNNGVWTLSQSHTKNAHPHLIPLSDFSQEILDSIKGYSGKTDFVFLAPQKKNCPIPHVGKVPERIREISGVSDFRFHDLRRTVGSSISRFNFSRVVAGKVLNHQQLSGDSYVTAIYDRYNYMDEKKEALQSWTDHIKSIIYN